MSEDNTATATTQELARKISTKFFNNGKKISALLLKDQDKVALGTIIGVAVGVLKGESDYGPWSALSGDFEATSYLTGESCRASKCFLPAGADAPIEAVVGKGGAQVAFALAISIKRDEESNTGFSYVVTTVKDPSAVDPLAGLRKLVSGQLKLTGK